jgi:tRNA(Ile)-lysidine synthase
MISVLDKPAGRRINLPYSLIFYVNYDSYLLGENLSILCPYPVIGGEHRLNIPGETRLPGWTVTAEILAGKPEGADAPSETDSPLPLVKGKGIQGLGFRGDAFTACLDLDRCGKELAVRKRQPGDFFQPLGMDKTKKVNRFMIDEKIPGFWRGKVPIVCSPQQILWLVGYRIDDRVKVKEKTERELKLEFRKTN